MEHILKLTLWERFWQSFIGKFLGSLALFSGKYFYINMFLQDDINPLS